MKKSCSLKISLTLILFAVFFNAKPVAASTQYVLSKFNTTASTYGIKGDFKIPSCNAGWSSSSDNRYNKINFEEWLPVNGNSGDWLELGYKKGNTADGTGNTAYYNGFFQSKQVDGVYTYRSLDKSFEVGEIYTFTIVDVDSKNLWEIYVGSTYFGTFGVSPSVASKNELIDQGFEITNHNATQSISSTTITNQMYYNGSRWVSLANRFYTTSDSSNLLSVSYDTDKNKTTFSKQN